MVLVNSSQSNFVCKGLCLYHTVPYFSSWAEGFLGWKDLFWAISPVEGASVAGMLWLPGSAPLNR